MTRNEALQAVYTKRIKELSRLTALAEKLNDGWVPNWLDTDEEKYYIATDFNSITVHTRKRYAAAGMIFFRTQEDAQRAIEEINTEILCDNISGLIQEIGFDGEYAIIPTSKEMLQYAKEILNENGFITTLDFKNKLRQQNLFMTQSDASTVLANMAAEQGWSRHMHSSGKYMLYKNDNK